MRVACFRGPEQPDTPAGNLERLAAVAQRAREGGAELLVAPELFLTGYAIGADAVRRLAEPIDGPSITAAAEIARRVGIALLFGCPELADAKAYNTAVLIGSSGLV